MRILLTAAALAAGGLIAYVDGSPGWDDTGVTAGALFLAAAAFGWLDPRRPWLWAAAVGLWIPLLGILRDGNYGALIAPAFALAGAYLGAALRGRRAPVNRGGTTEGRR